MNRAIVGVVLVLGCVAVWGQATDAPEPPPRVSHIFGPRVGATYIAVDPDDFDERMREVFPNSDRSYFPLITQFGVNLEQRILLGDSGHHFAFQEVLIIGGLDQNIFIPSGTVIIGFRFKGGFEVGLGPNISLARVDEETKAGLTVAYAIGYTFTFQDVFVPLNLAVVPTPLDGHPRFTLLTGFNFERRR